MSLDGLPLTTGFTGLQAWRLIEPALLSHLRVDPGGSESGLTPIGGHVSLQTNRGNSGPWLQMAGGSYQFQHLSLGYRSRQIQIGTSLSRDQGDFSYFDDRGTLFFKDDDQWVTRQNNARQRINSLFSWQRGPYRSQWFLLDSQAVYRVQVIDKREQQQNQSICIDSASAIESRIEGYNFTSLSVSRTRLIP